MPDTASLVAPAAPHSKSAGYARRWPTHAEARAPAFAKSANPESPAGDRCVARPCAPLSLLQGHPNTSLVEVQGEDRRSSWGRRKVEPTMEQSFSGLPRGG